MQIPMLRSLPPITRVIPALILTLITTIAVYKFLGVSLRSFHFGALDAQQCDADGYCDAAANEDLLKPPSRQEFSSLEYRIKSLGNEIEALKRQPLAKELSLDEQRWEALRTQCGEGVVRNIDYQHVIDPTVQECDADSRVSITRNSGHPRRNNSGQENDKVGNPTWHN